MALPTSWWRDRALLAAELERHADDNHAVAQAHGISESTVRKWRIRTGLPPSKRRGAAEPRPKTDGLNDALRRLAERAAA